MEINNEMVNGQELVQAMAEKIPELAKETTVETGLNKVTELATVPQIQPKKSYTLKNALIGGGLVITGGALGFAVDHWVVPLFSEEAREERRAKKEAKRAEKKAKRDAKKGGKKPVTKSTAKTEAKPAAAEPNSAGIDPNEINVEAEIK